MTHTSHWRPFRTIVLAFVGVLGLGLSDRAWADVILYTASTDDSGGIIPVSAPNATNPYLPAVSAGVTMTPNPALLDGNLVGPINGTTYGPFGFAANAGGTTGFAHVSYTLTTTGSFKLVWEVSDTIDHSRPSALAIDNVRLNGTLLFGFDSGIPGGFSALGSVGTSPAVTDLAPTQGTAFAYLDTTGNVKPIYDTVDGTFGSRLVSTVFTASAGTVLSLDLAFMTNDGDPFHDYGIAVLQAVPEPGTLMLASLTLVTVAGLAGIRRRGVRAGGIPESQDCAVRVAADDSL